VTFWLVDYNLLTGNDTVDVADWRCVLHWVHFIHWFSSDCFNCIGLAGYWESWNLELKFFEILELQSWFPKQTYRNAFADVWCLTVLPASSMHQHLYPVQQRQSSIRRRRCGLCQPWGGPGGHETKQSIDAWVVYSISLQYCSSYQHPFSEFS